MNIEPTVQISACIGGYFIQVIGPCDCGECDGWEMSDRVFTDLTLALRFVKESIELYEARDETKQIDAKLKQS